MKAFADVALVGEFALVDHHPRSESVRFGDHEKAIEHARMWLRLRGCKDHDDLIQICNHDPFAAGPTGRATRELAASRIDLVNCPRRFACVAGNHDAIADCEFEWTLDAFQSTNATHRFALRIALAFTTAVVFESTAQRYVKQLAIVGTHLIHTAGPFHHDAVAFAHGDSSALLSGCTIAPRTSPSRVAFTVKSCIAPS